MRLDVLLGRLPEVATRSQAALLIESGRVLVDGRVRSKSYRLESGQVVTVTPTAGLPPAATVTASQTEIDVRFEDGVLLVVDKPAGMVVHPAKGHTEGTLVQALVSRGVAGGETFRPGVVHRLDKDTSGLLLLAKDVATHRGLTRMIQQREVERTYLVLLHGNLTESSGTIEAPIGRDPVRRKTMAISGAAPRPAVSHFSVKERLGEFTLVEARLETGRTHQLRVHFLAIGHPVAGDPTYGRRDPLGIGRQFLHSHRLRLAHPVTGEEICVVSALPEDLARALTRARGLRPR